MRKTIPTLVAAVAVATLTAAPAQARTGCVNSDEWHRLYNGQYRPSAERVMGATGDTWQTDTKTNPDGTVTRTYLIRYTACSDLGGKAWITYKEKRSASWTITKPQYIVDRLLTA